MLSLHQTSAFSHRMRPLFTIEIPSYQSHKNNASTGSSTNKLPENKNSSKECISRAETKTEQLGKFGPDLNALEGGTQKLLRDQTSLNFNLLGRLQRPQISSSPQGRPSVRGPLQHPYTHFQQPSNSGRFSANHDVGIGAVDVEMSDAPDINGTKLAIVLKENGRQNEDAVPASTHSPITAFNIQNLVLSPSKIPHHSTSNTKINSAQHPALKTITTNISDQIELEISHLIVKKHNELRLIESELAKAQIMLEQLRRVHLRPFNLVQNEKGEVYAVRFVVRSYSGERKRKKTIEKRQMRDVKAAEELEMEERKKGGSGMGLRNRYVRR
ncbi:18c5524f-0b9e-4717-9007-9e9e29aaded4-CDS [Sclerotinia trifoliorum]|uniref:18c5524f-0b9e-4717-9007-9e9e29aaded4-CDS n=1 Tax=Sclerotinia trifoliorum TaxID=28548 RepID=A0A8H2VUY0_9HELO|nr:18c5524f-0b9e-4717-9007-9e9e29aaded4-CDS [Sclerotinia trifoliorum]